jgi:hypothetical protein
LSKGETFYAAYNPNFMGDQVDSGAGSGGLQDPRRGGEAQAHGIGLAFAALNENPMDGPF